MSETPDPFAWLSERLEATTAMNRLEARGTVRIALKNGGLRPESVTPEQLSVVVTNMLPEELAARGQADAEALCARLDAELREQRFAARDADTPDAVFKRLGS